MTDDTDIYETRMTHGGQYLHNRQQMTETRQHTTDKICIDIYSKNFTKLAIRTGTLHVFAIIQHEYLTVVKIGSSFHQKQNFNIQKKHIKFS